MTIENVEAKDLSAMMAAGEVMLIDVREKGEYAVERIAGAALYPLSSFDPAALPNPAGKRVVFHCAGGVRSARAVAACQAAGFDYRVHLKGGLWAWKSAGLAVER
jgi:rhodanese-related sulfurtransferase